jgi:transcriptional regulator with XRE-family HTH domain
MLVRKITTISIEVPDLAFRIRTARKAKYPSVRKAANAIGRNENWLCGIETGRTKSISYATLKEIEADFGVKFGVESLFCEHRQER